MLVHSPIELLKFRKLAPDFIVTKQQVQENLPPFNRLKKLSVYWICVRAQLSVIQTKTVPPQFKQNLNLSKKIRHILK